MLKKGISPLFLGVGILLCVVVAAGVGALWLTTGKSNPISTETLYSCNNTMMTKAQIATYRGITVAQMDGVYDIRNLTPPEVCTIKDSDLKRAVNRITSPKPTGAGDAEEWRFSRLVGDNKAQIPIGAREKAYEQARELGQKPGGSIQRNTAGIYPGGWDWIGPGNIGGRIRSIVIDPTNPDVMYAASVAGGIWKTTNGGVQWNILNDFLSNMAVSTLWMDPSNPQTIYAGTGEGFFNADGRQGAGIFKTTNGGANWTTLPSTQTPDFLFVNRLSGTPGASLLLAATRTGIFRSTDGGATWSKQLDSKDAVPVTATNYVRASAYDINISPTDNNKAIASGNFGRAWYSTNGGSSWMTATFSPVLTTNVSINAGGYLMRIETAYARSNPNIVYASINAYTGSANRGLVYKSTDGGATYTQVSGAGAPNFLSGQGWYDNIIWVDPTNPNTVIVGGVDLFRSVNGGVDWTKISQWQSAPISAHADQHYILEHPNFNGTTNTTVFFTNDGGVYKVGNVNTVSQVVGWQELNNNLGITQFYGGGVNTQGVAFGGTQDNGTLRYTGNTENWNEFFGGDGGFQAVDQTDPNYSYGEYVYLQIHRTADGGASAGYIYTGIGDAGNSAAANFIAPFILDPNNANSILAGGANLWRSTNVKAATPTWTAIKAPTLSAACRSATENSCISAIAVAKGNSNVIWVGHNNGDVYFTTNGLAAMPTWTRVDNGTTPLPDRFVTRITIDPVDSTKVYVTFGGFFADNIYLTTNSGTSFTVNTGTGANKLPETPVYSLAIHPNITNWLYVATDTGVFASEDGGVTWKVAPNDGPSNAPVDELQWGGPKGVTLVAATHGRGMFKMEVPGNVPSLSNSGLAYVELTGNGNGVPEPGEIISITLSYRNRGPQNATGVSGNLSVITGSATVLNPNVAYPNIAKEGGTASNTVSYKVKIDPATSCGADITLRHTLSYSPNFTMTYDFKLKIGTLVLGSPQTYTYSGPSRIITDANATGILVPINVPASGKVGDINVKVDITHPYIGDLTAFLYNGNLSKNVVLVANRGGEGVNMTNTIFDDEAATEIGAGTPPFTGSFKPEEPLSYFDGDNQNGNWVLRVVDPYNQDEGTLNSWSITIQEGTYTCQNFTNATPTLTSVTPNYTAVGSPSKVITLTGTGFAADSVARFAGNDLTTGFVSSTQLTATVPASAFTNAGTFTVTVFTPAPGGGESNAVNFLVGTCNASLVTSPTDDGSGLNCGTLSFALTQSAGVTITFALTGGGNTITMTGQLSSIVQTGATIDGGDGNGIVILGAGVSGDGLRLAGDNKLKNLSISGFGGREIVSTGQNNRFDKVRVNNT